MGYYKENLAAADTQLKWSHHERCLGSVLWVPEDEDNNEQQDEDKDADKHNTPHLRPSQSI